MVANLPLPSLDPLISGQTIYEYKEMCNDKNHHESMLIFSLKQHEDEYKSHSSLLAWNVFGLFR